MADIQLYMYEFSSTEGYNTKLRMNIIGQLVM